LSDWVHARSLAPLWSIFKILCPLCECAILLLQALPAKILNPRFVTSYQASTQVTRTMPAAVANAIFQ